MELRLKDSSVRKSLKRILSFPYLGTKGIEDDNANLQLHLEKVREGMMMH